MAPVACTQSRRSATHQPGRRQPLPAHPAGTSAWDRDRTARSVGEDLGTPNCPIANAAVTVMRAATMRTACWDLGRTGRGHPAEISAVCACGWGLTGTPGAGPVQGQQGARTENHRGPLPAMAGVAGRCGLEQGSPQPVRCKVTWLPLLVGCSLPKPRTFANAPVPPLTTRVSGLPPVSLYPIVVMMPFFSA